MNFVLKPPSLEQRALVKMAVSLWNQNDIGALMSLANIENLWNLYPLNEKWKRIEARVLERVPRLPLPQLLNEKVSCFIQTVGLEIYEWIKFHCLRYNLDLSLPFELCWTPQGTVDRKRTAQVLVRDESLDLSTRYKLACLYCLEDSIDKLWDSMLEDLRESDWYRYPPIGFWSRTLKRRGLGNAHNSYKAEFKLCASEGNKVAAEYFLQKLTPREREESLVEAAKSVMIDADTLCFLLSEMDEQQQMKVFKNNPHRVLNYFLEWPFQSFFIEIANCMWDFLLKGVYENILSSIIDKVRGGYKDWNYLELFREFWQKSPDALKSFITNDLDGRDLLSDLFINKEKEIIRLILQDASPTARKELVYSNGINDFWEDCICDDDWDFLEFFIRECFSSKDLMLKFKENFEYRIKWKSVEDIFVRNKDKWDKLFLSSDDSLRGYEKRSNDEGGSSSSKRFRSLE